MAKSGERIDCILHVGGKTSEVVSRFNAESWNTITRAAEKRLSRWKDSKYTTICENLPEVYGDSDGFHQTCYSNFTAVPSGTAKPKTEESRTSEKPFLRSEVDKLADGNSGIFINKCLFCGKMTRGTHRESLGMCESYNAADNIKAAARKLNDSRLITKIADIDFCAKEVKYHHSCRRLYLKKAHDVVEASTSQPVNTCRNPHTDAFSHLKEYVQSFIIDGQQPEMLSSVFQRYLSYLTEHGINETPYTKQKLEEKLLRYFSGVLNSGKRYNKEGTMLYSSDDTWDSAFIKVSSIGSKINDVALHLRRNICVLQKESEELPHPLTAQAAAEGQCNEIDLLTQFFRVLYTGSPGTQGVSERVERYVLSSADDAIYAVTRGLIKPAKHLLLGLGLKSLVGSRRVIEILNKFGHCIGYHTAEGLETELAMSVKEKTTSIPDGLLKKAGLATGLAWDNYDENTETLSGSGTLHDTVGICYQNIVEDSDDNRNVNQLVAGSLQKVPRRTQKRKFEASDDEARIEPYRKKPKIGGFDYNLKTATNKPPASLHQARQRDLIWTLLFTRYNDTPMWAGWNSCVTTDQLPKQKIGYMENLCLPPTRLDVVVETLRISQNVADECNDKYAIVHYDLAVAKPAMQIQYEQSPRFDNVFICFGPFHIELAFFGAIGYILAESGGPHILEDTRVLAGGSVNGFLSGKHYNRCKRIHPLLALSFRLLHMDSFLQEQGPIPDVLLQSLTQLHENPIPSVLDTIEQRGGHEDFLRRYEEYCEKTRSGTHGSTAQFWLMYVELIELYLVFSRAYRTNDVDLFTYALERMCPVFFATNRPNYARWMTRYHLNLLNMNDTHPGIREYFQKGALSVRHTDKGFSRTPVDLTLEQTINADAASRLTGITAFTQSISARKRWMITRTVRSSIVGHLLTKVGLVKQTDAHKDTKFTRVERDNSDLQKLMTGINETMNPFNENVANKKLYCISTGQVMTENIKDDVLTILAKGELRYNEFKNGCLTDPTRFEKPIPKLKCKLFSSAVIKTKLEVKDKTIIELKGTRDLFGRLVFLATEGDVDLLKVFEYPITPVPLTLAQVDGSMNKTDKSKLMHVLENRLADTRPPPDGHVYMQDAMFLLQALVNIPETFGAIAKVILMRLCKVTSDEIHFVCDTYPTGSIKNIERSCRAKGEVSDFRVTGADQRRPKDFSKLLRSSVFKVSFVAFLAEEWKRDIYVNILGNKTVIMGLEKVCHRFMVGENGSIIRDVVAGLNCNHEEADTRLALHLAYVAGHTRIPNVIIRCNDTDVLVILLYHLGTGNIKAQVWMDAGVDAKNSRRYINVTGLSKELGHKLCRALPGIHAFTGCDYTTSFLRKGKLRPLQVIEKSSRHIDTFGALGESPTLTNMVGFEEFVCELYGKPNTKSVSAARFAIFRDKYAPTNKASPLEKLKGADASVLPPSSPVLVQKVRRTNYVSYMWKRANCQYLPDINATEHGWDLKEGQLVLKWFDGQQVPKCIANVVDPKTFNQDEDTYDNLDQLVSSDSDSDTDSDPD